MRPTTDKSADLAIIVISTNEARWLDGCLSTVFAHAGTATLDVVVVDNESIDGTRELVESAFPRARVLTAANRGFAHGNNRGLETTTARYVLFLNPDTQIVQGTFGGLVDALDARPDLGLVGVRQLTPDDELFPTIRRFPNALRALGDALACERWPVHPSWAGERVLDPAAYEREYECDWTSGSFMLARREALLSAGLLDERFFIYAEEPDLCLRIKRAGWKVLHLPSMSIIHHAGKGGVRPRMVAQHVYALRQYAAKHFAAPHRLAYLTAIGLRYVIRALAAGRDATTAPARRESARLALRTLVGWTGPPFGVPPYAAVISAPAVAAAQPRPPAHAQTPDAGGPQVPSVATRSFDAESPPQTVGDGSLDARAKIRSRAPNQSNSTEDQSEMEMITAFRALVRRWYLVLLVVLAAGGIAAAVKLSSHSVPTGVATVQIFVDSPQSALADLQQDTVPLATRASVFAQLMTSGAVLTSIAHSAGVPPADLTAEGPFSGAGQTLDVPTPSAARGNQLVAVSQQYHLTFVAQPNIPIITASVQGPSASTAASLAKSVYPGVQSWLSTLQSVKIKPRHRVTIRQLGDAQAGSVNSSSAVLAAAAGAGALMLGLLLVIGIDLVITRRRGSGSLADGPTHPDLASAGGYSAAPGSATNGDMPADEPVPQMVLAGLGNHRNGAASEIELSGAGSATELDGAASEVSSEEHAAGLRSTEPTPPSRVG
jgi:GT2 family glycosyltransferase/capsular polysaccharide biosynthesis protein